MARDRKRPGWFLAPWAHRLIRKRGKAERLRAMHGDLCWLCGHPMRFGGPPNCGRAATIEHVTPLSRGGTWALDNLRLCHAGCNRHLADHLPEQKEGMRVNRARHRPA
jgi:5-methylcytosine-specific restriction endonuclease McrA